MPAIQMLPVQILTDPMCVPVYRVIPETAKVVNGTEVREVMQEFPRCFVLLYQVNVIVESSKKE